MNVFMPFDNCVQSVQALDDVRLRKQILECVQIKHAIDNILRVQKGGYVNHPVVKYYVSNLPFLICYANECRFEYVRRFGKNHAYARAITNDYVALNSDLQVFEPATIFYCEKQTREYDPAKSTALFKHKLCEKWINDIVKGRPPKWTARGTPSFFIDYIRTHLEELDNAATIAFHLRNYLIKNKYL